MRSYFTFDMHTLYHILQTVSVHIYMFVRRSGRVVAMLFFFVPRARVNDSFSFLHCVLQHMHGMNWHAESLSLAYTLAFFHSGTSREATPSQGVCLLVFARSGTSILSTYRQKYIMSYLFNLLLFLQLYASGPLLLRFLTKVDVASPGAQRAVGAAEQLGIWLHRREFFSKLHGKRLKDANAFLSFKHSYQTRIMT